MLVEQLKGNATLRYLCGWDGRNQVPSESTFSRAFTAFAVSGAVTEVHSLLVRDSHQEKVVGHCAKDATAVHAREHHCRTHDKPLKQKRKRGRRPKGAPAPEPIKPRRVELQASRTLQANLCDLPKGCDWGIKKNSQGKCEQWKGYKLHADYSDAGVPLIDPNPRGGNPIPFAPAQAARYSLRTTAERGFSELKDNYGLENIRVKGHWKVFCHVMFSVLALTSKTLFNMIC